MSQIKYISVIDTEDAGRQIKAGKADPSGSWVKIPTPDNGLEDMERIHWERVGVFKLPEPMPKSDFKGWWNENKDAEPQPHPIPEVLAAMDAGEQGASV